jgi:hypothetical protein
MSKNLNIKWMCTGTEDKKEGDEREELDFMFDEEMDIPAAKNNRSVSYINIMVGSPSVHKVGHK